MKTQKFVLAAAVLGLLSTAAFATTVAAHNQTLATIKFEAPAPAKVVNPTGLSRRAEGSTVTLHMTIDAAGQAHDIKVVSRGNDAVARSVVAAVAQWQFSPGRKNGTPVPTKVELPVEIARNL